MIEEFSKYYWYMDRCGYVCTRSNKTRLKMHKEVMRGIKGEVIDHINRNKLDNRRENLRVTTFSMNCYNQNLVGGKSGVVGVYERNGRWRAGITINGKNIHLGYFDTMSEAIDARKKAEIEYRGELKNK